MNLILYDVNEPDMLRIDDREVKKEKEKYAEQTRAAPSGACGGFLLPSRPSVADWRYNIYYMYPAMTVNCSKSLFDWFWPWIKLYKNGTWHCFAVWKLREIGCYVWPLCVDGGGCYSAARAIVETRNLIEEFARTSEPLFTVRSMIRHSYNRCTNSKNEY